MNYENRVKISGLVHFTGRKKEQKYFPFSVRHENLWTDGTTRKDFLDVRAFKQDLQEKLKDLDENSPVEISGILRSSKGSGELYLDAEEINTPENLSTLENQVNLSGIFHVIKAQNEGITGTGKYIRFAVRQDLETGRDFLTVRVYDDELKKTLDTKNDGDTVEVEGTLRSSKGSGVNYVRCTALK